MAIYLKEDLIVEVALMHKYGKITVLLFSKYASPISVERRPNKKLRLSVDLSKINTLTADDSTNNVHLVRTLPDAAQYVAGKNSILQARLLPSSSLFADGGPTVCGNACIRFC